MTPGLTTSRLTCKGRLVWWFGWVLTPAQKWPVLVPSFSMATEQVSDTSTFHSLKQPWRHLPWNHLISSRWPLCSHLLQNFILASPITLLQPTSTHPGIYLSMHPPEQERFLLFLSLLSKVNLKWPSSTLREWSNLLDLIRWSSYPMSSVPSGVHHLVHSSFHQCRNLLSRLKTACQRRKQVSTTISMDVQSSWHHSGNPVTCMISLKIHHTYARAWKTATLYVNLNDTFYQSELFH